MKDVINILLCGMVSTVLGGAFSQFSSVELFALLSFIPFLILMLIYRHEKKLEEAHNKPKEYIVKTGNG